MFGRVAGPINTGPSSTAPVAGNGLLKVAERGLLRSVGRGPLEVVESGKAAGADLGSREGPIRCALGSGVGVGVGVGVRSGGSGVWYVLIGKSNAPGGT